MAAPTNARVESIDIDTNVVRWTDNGGGSNDIYRSVNGSSYTEIGSDILAGVQIYTDGTASGGVKYWYKVTNDNGSTFSTAVTVVTQTCPDLSRRRQAIPAYVDDGDTISRLNSLAEQVQADKNRSVFIGGDGTPALNDLCTVCIDDGALVLDCSNGCDAFSLNITEDAAVNSISLTGCGPCPPLSIYVAPHKTLQLCGWPSDCPYDGDECAQAPLEGGAEGRTFQASSGTSTPGGGGGGSSSSDVCDCSDFGGGSLAIACCDNTFTNVDDEGLGDYVCYDTFPCGQSNPIGLDYSAWIHLTVCNGQGPYSWEFGGANVNDFPTALQFFNGPNGTCIGDRDGVDGPTPPIVANEVWVFINHLGYTGAPCAGFTDLYVRVTDSSITLETADYILLP